MKKLFATVILMAIMLVSLSLDLSAQTRKRSFYRRHRNAINVGASTLGGAVIGGLIGGRRGAGVGALSGAGAGALYTYKIKPKRRRY